MDELTKWRDDAVEYTDYSSELWVIRCRRTIEDLRRISRLVGYSGKTMRIERRGGEETMSGQTAEGDMIVTWIDVTLPSSHATNYWRLWARAAKTLRWFALCGYFLRLKISGITIIDETVNSAELSHSTLRCRPRPLVLHYLSAVLGLDRAWAVIISDGRLKCRSGPGRV